MRPAQVGSRAILVAGHGAAIRAARVAQGTGPPSGTDDFPPDCLLARTRQSRSFWPRTHIALNNKRQMAHPTRFEHVTFAFGGQRSTLRAALDRHNLLGIEPVVDPISPMLHQFRARADQRERSFHYRVVEMREF